MYIKNFILYLCLLSITIANNITINNTNKFEIRQIDDTSIEIESIIESINFNSIEINNELFEQIQIEGSYPSTNELGSPNLPMINQLIEIPRNSTVRIEIIEDNTELYNLNELQIINKISPIQPSISKSDNNGNEFLNINHAIYNTNDFYNNDLVLIEEKGFLREVKIGNLMISPIEYNPVENQIIVHHNLKFKIHFDNADIQLTNEKKSNKYSPYFEPIFQTMIANYISPQQTRDNDFIDDVVSYVIIADPSFESSLAPFIEWKSQKGYHVIVAYTNEIGSSSNAIESFLENQYNNPPNNVPSPTFVLLVGDTPQIPASYSSGGHVSDLDYCDYTNDNLPDVLCGRFSAQNTNHVLAQINKTIEYEKYEMPDPSYLNEVLMVSGVDASFAPTYGNGQINYGNSYYFNSNYGITSNTFLYPASGNSASQILNIANNGVSFINYTAHGWESGWADPEFDLNDANNMTNYNQYSTMIGNCCLTNAFDSGTCFGEALLRKNNAGAIAYIGGSDVTYWDEDFWWGVGSGGISANPSYNNTGTGAYDGIFHPNNESNWAIVNSAIIMLGNLAVAQANGMDDYYWEIYHLMGDPAISTYFSVPDNNNVNFNPFLPVGSEAIEIQAEPHSYIGITQDGELLSAGTVDESGFVVLIFDPAVSEPGTLEIVATSQNKIPYFGEIFVASPDGAYTTVNNVNFNVGNDNVISIGELITIDILVENVGNEIADNIILSMSVENNDPYIQLINQQSEISNLNPNETTTIQLSFEALTNSPLGHAFTINIAMNSNESSWEAGYDLSTEPLIESFETNSFDNLLWQNAGNTNWGIDYIGSVGNYSAKSGAIDHNMVSELFIEIEIVEDGYISFDKKVSCEDVGTQSGNFYDFLAFYIDGVEQSKWAGEIDWSESNFPVSAGNHTFSWKYIKDQGVTSGQDAVWVDNISFPPCYYNAILYGDVNDDSNINIQDVILSVNIVLGNLEFIEAADVNMDSNVDVLDIILIVNMILQ